MIVRFHNHIILVSWCTGVLKKAAKGGLYRVAALFGYLKTTPKTHFTTQELNFNWQYKVC
jgi:hypothetical protein